MRPIGKIDKIIKNSNVKKMKTRDIYHKKVKHDAFFQTKNPNVL